MLNLFRQNNLSIIVVCAASVLTGCASGIPGASTVAPPQSPAYSQARLQALSDYQIRNFIKPPAGSSVYGVNEIVVHYGSQLMIFPGDSQITRSATGVVSIYDRVDNVEGTLVSPNATYEIIRNGMRVVVPPGKTLDARYRSLSSSLLEVTK